MKRRIRASVLFLEEVFESLTGVVGARRGSGNGSGLRWLRVGVGRGVLFDGHAEFVELAVVLRVFGRNALGDRLRAFKLRTAIEKAALLAAVKLEAALGALPVGIKTRSENGAAIGAAPTRNRADHARSARTELIGARAALRRLAVRILFAFIAFFRVAIASMTVLAIHKRLRAHTMTGFDLHCFEQRAHAHSNRGINPIGVLHSAHSAIIPQGFRTGLATSKREMGQLCL